MHIRHDVTKIASADENAIDTPPSVAVPSLRRHVDEIARELAITTGSTVTRVVVFSDEPNPAWWAEIGTEGWYFVDHSVEQTADLYGEG